LKVDGKIDYSRGSKGFTPVPEEHPFYKRTLEIGKDNLWSCFKHNLAQIHDSNKFFQSSQELFS